MWNPYRIWSRWPSTFYGNLILVLLGKEVVSSTKKVQPWKAQKKWQWCLSWSSGIQEGKWQSLLSSVFGASAVLHGRNLTSIPFISIICFDWLATYHIKYFRLQLVLKFYVFPRQLQTWLIWQQELIFCWSGWKCKEVNVLISCHYLKVL